MLLHLARLRGGISDLLQILNLDLSDDQQIEGKVFNTLTKLKQKIFKEMIDSKSDEYIQGPAQMLYKIPANSSVAWNGQNLFYVGNDQQSIVKCEGEIKRADFGK